MGRWKIVYTVRHRLTWPHLLNDTLDTVQGEGLSKQKGCETRSSASPKRLQLSLISTSKGRDCDLKKGVAPDSNECTGPLAHANSLSLHFVPFNCSKLRRTDWQVVNDHVLLYVCHW